MSDENDKPKVSFRKLDVPFDLESIFTMQFDVSGLRAVLEFILEHLGNFKEDFSGIKEHIDK